MYSYVIDDGNNSNHDDNADEDTINKTTDNDHRGGYENSKV